MSMPSAAKRILVCEDNHAIATGWAAILEGASYQVVGPVSSVEMALERAYRDLPDMVLVGIGLSGMIDGISVVAEIAPLGVPVVFVTADYRRALVEGRELAVDILIKPVQPITLVKSVDSVLRKARAD
jgi:two-component system, response regulator PdtaR